MRRLSSFFLLVFLLIIGGCAHLEPLKEKFDHLQKQFVTVKAYLTDVTVALSVVAEQYGEGTIKLNDKTAEVVQKGVEQGKKAGVTLDDVDDILNEIGDAIPESGKWDFSSIIKVVGALIGIGLSLTGRNVETMTA
jgi:hypothetical protein